mmetsp:Transcript_22842/g.47495  ORF Transcript_22842/g.47495 Transcript_22842/m.47495 type:complete len:204 (-) Transcript_22842:681-1292(-)
MPRSQRKCQLRICDIPLNLFIRRSSLDIKRMNTSEHNIDDHTQGPHIRGRQRRGAPIRKRLRWTIRRCKPTHPHFLLLPLPILRRQIVNVVIVVIVILALHLSTPKIHQLHHPIPPIARAQHQILRLDIIVHHADPMQKVQSARHFSHQPRRIGLAIRPVIDQMIEHFAPLDQIQYQIVIPPLVEMFAKGADMRVPPPFLDPQ